MAANWWKDLRAINWEQARDQANASQKRTAWTGIFFIVSSRWSSTGRFA